MKIAQLDQEAELGVGQLATSSHRYITASSEFDFPSANTIQYYCILIEAVKSMFMRSLGNSGATDRPQNRD
jgi:hypothetical protein